MGQHGNGMQWTGEKANGKGLGKDTAILMTGGVTDDLKVQGSDAHRS